MGCVYAQGEQRGEVQPESKPSVHWPQEGLELSAGVHWPGGRSGSSVNPAFLRNQPLASQVLCF